jgi:hypothetical protein
MSVLEIMEVEMSRHLVVAHRTLGGDHLLEHLKGLAAEDPSCQFHVVVPRYTPREEMWSHGTTQDFAKRHLTEMLGNLASCGLQATGEVGSTNPVKAIGHALGSQGADAFDGCVLSTLPEGSSRWWQTDVPSGIAKSFPTLNVTHLVGKDATTAAGS